MNEKIEKNEKNENQNAMKSNNTNYNENVDDIFDSKIYRNFLIVNIFVIDDFNANEFEMKNEKNELNEQEKNNYIDWQKNFYEYRVMINMYVMQNNKKMFKWIQKIDENDWIKNQYDDEIALLIDDVKTNIKRHDVNKLKFIVINIRFDKSNCKFISITLIVINKKQWRTKIETILLQKWKRHIDYSLKIIFEILNQIHNVDIDDVVAIKKTYKRWKIQSHRFVDVKFVQFDKKNNNKFV